MCTAREGIDVLQFGLTRKKLIFINTEPKLGAAYEDLRRMIADKDG